MNVTQTELSRIFNISDRAIRDWDKSGCPSIIFLPDTGTTTGKSKGKKLYDTSAVIDWYVKRELEKNSDDSAPIDDEEYKDAKKRSAIAKASRDESAAEEALFQLALTRQSLLPIEDVEELFQEVAAALLQRIDAVPYRYIPDIQAAGMDTLKIRAALKKAMKELQLEVSKLVLDGTERDT